MSKMRGVAVGVLLAAALFSASASPLVALKPFCSVLEYGAVGDNVTEDTGAVASAIAACATVTFPSPRTYLIRPVKLDAHDGLTLNVEAGATISAWRDVDTYNVTSAVYPLLYSDGYRACADTDENVNMTLCPAPLVNFTLMGGGTIDGQGWRWWPFLKTRSRPILLNLARAEHLLISNITLLDSPSFHIQVRGSDMEIAHVRIHAGGCHGWATAPNTDGINIGGQRIHVHDCFVHNGDDCIPTNVGWNNTDTQHVLVERVQCECGTNGGVAIIAGKRNIRDVVYRDMIVSNTNQGAGVKISEAYESPSGVFMNVSWRNISIVNPRYAAIYTNLFQEDSQAKQCFVPVNASRPANWLSAVNLSFVDITATINSTAGAYGGCFVCSPTRPCSGFAFDRVTVTDVAGEPASHSYICDNVGYTSAGSAPAPCASL